MPGLLMMNNSGADNATGPRDGESKKRSHDGKLVNGERTPRKDTPAGSTAPNGSSDGPGVNGASAPVSSLSMPSSSSLAELPPEIVHVASEFYHPLSKLLQRIAQDCSNDLSEVLQTMAEMPISQQRNGAMPNGVGSYGVTNGADNELSKTKKLLLMKFAQDNRSKFIKLLVLAEWGKKSSIDVAKLIDLFTWAREQSSYMDFVDTQIESIKWLSNHARQYNPDIRTALEVLSTGKAGWIPDMGYAPPEPISSDKALKLLRYANTSLSIRLNVHENLPRHLRNWRIEDGRATFVIDNEFEFDVMSFVEDASDQWFFIDLRLLFSPAPSITIGSRFMMSLKTQVDYILNQQGLTGCFEFLHNFALTHKISVLRSQAHELWRSTWAGSLKVEPVHRALVIQYWIDRPGKKNWIEIGLSSNRPKSGKVSWRGPPLSSLTIRWFRHGVEVKDANLKPDWKSLSVERILKQVIALHIGHILQTTQSHLNPGITIKAGLSESEPTDCTLEASLGTSTNKMILSLEPVTGAYILQPATMLSARAEHAINQGREPTQIGLIITQLLAQTLQDLVLKHAQQVGWQPISRQSLRSDVVKKALNLDVLQYALFWSRGWSPNWALAAITDSSGESWWICEIGSKGNTIEYAEKLNMERPDGKSLPINRSTLASIERVAVQHVSFRVTARQLAKEKKQYTLRYEFGQYKHAATSKRIIRGWVMCLRTADLLTPTPGEEPWLESTIAVTCEGFRQDNRNIWHIASGRMVKDVAADMQKLMAASPQNNFSFSEDGAFNILLSTPFGQDILGELKARLRDVNRLRSFAMTLQKRKMLIKSSSLQKVQFQYGKSHVVAVNFGADDGITIELATNNPHYRVRKLLTEIVNDRSPTLSNTHLIGGSGLDRFCSALVLTRPLQTVLQEIENSKPDNVRNPAIHTHAIGKYRITYENPLCSFDIRLQLKEDRNFWVIEDNNRKNNESRPSPERGANHRRLESLQTALKNLFKEKGDHWFGTRSGIVAQIDGVADAVRKLHKAVQSCEMEGGYKPPPVPPNAGSQGPPNANGPTQQQGPGKPGAPGRQQPPQGPGGPGRQQPPQQGSRGGSLSNSRQQGKVGNMAGKASMASRDIIEID